MKKTKIVRMLIKKNSLNQRESLNRRNMAIEAGVVISKEVAEVDNIIEVEEEDIITTAKMVSGKAINFKGIINHQTLSRILEQPILVNNKCNNSSMEMDNKCTYLLK